MMVHTGNRARFSGVMVEFFDAALVRSRLAEMGDTLKRLRARGLRPAGYLSAWPDFVREYWDEFSAAVARGGEWEAAQVALSPPDPAAITRMDECFDWFRLVPEDSDRRLLWAYALNVNQRRIARLMGIHRETLRRRIRDAVGELVGALNRRIEGR